MQEHCMNEEAKHSKPYSSLSPSSAKTTITNFQALGKKKKTQFTLQSILKIQIGQSSEAKESVSWGGGGVDREHLVWGTSLPVSCMVA